MKRKLKDLFTCVPCFANTRSVSDVTFLRVRLDTRAALRAAYSELPQFTFLAAGGADVAALAGAVARDWVTRPSSLVTATRQRTVLSVLPCRALLLTDHTLPAWNTERGVRVPINTSL